MSLDLKTKVKKSLEVIKFNHGVLPDDTYIDKFIDSLKERLTDSDQLSDWGLLSFLNSVLDDNSAASLQVFAVRLSQVIVKNLPHETDRVIKTIPSSLLCYNTGQYDDAETVELQANRGLDTAVLHAVAGFLVELMQVSNEPAVLKTSQFCVQVGLWSKFVKPMLLDAVDKSLHLTKICEQLLVALVGTMVTAAEVRGRTETFANFDKVVKQIFGDLATMAGPPAHQTRPLLRVLETSRQSRNYMNEDKGLVRGLRQRLVGNTMRYSEIKDTLDLLAQLGGSDSVKHLMLSVLDSFEDYSESTIKAVILVALKHYRDFRKCSVYFLDMFLFGKDSEEILNLCIFTVAIITSLKICDTELHEKITAILTKVLEDGHKDLQEGISEKLAINAVVSCRDRLSKNDKHFCELIQTKIGILARVLKRYMGVSDSLKSNIIMLLSTVFQFSDSCENLSDVIQIILWQASGISWGIRDSAFQCISSLVSNTHLMNRLSFDQLKMVANVLQASKCDENSFIRAAVLKAFSFFVGNGGLDHMDAILLINDMKKVLAGDTEAIVRREAVGVIRTIYHNLDPVDKETRRLIEYVMIQSLLDFDWEVKLNVVGFWNSVVEVLKDRDNIVRELTDHNCLTAAVMAVKDYEDVVVECALKLIETIKAVSGLGNNVERSLKYRKLERDNEKCNTALAGKPHHNKLHVNVDDVIDDIVTSEEVDLVKELISQSKKISAVDETNCDDVQVKIKPEKFVELLENLDFDISDRNDRLESALDDIIQVGVGEALVEGIDCY